MVHNCRCENANPKNKCHCSCAGKYHGSAFGKSEDEVENVLPMTASMGAELDKYISELWGKHHICTCGQDMVLMEFRGYLSTLGLMDSDGTKWCAYVRCPKCNYDWSLTKLYNRVKFWGC